MSGKAKRNRQKRTTVQTHSTCPNCGEDGPHYVPPSMGEDGFYICAAIDAARKGGGR
jgi:ribosomal protein L32